MRIKSLLHEETPAPEAPPASGSVGETVQDIVDAGAELAQAAAEETSPGVSGEDDTVTDEAEALWADMAEDDDSDFNESEGEPEVIPEGSETEQPPQEEQTPPVEAVQPQSPEETQVATPEVQEPAPQAPEPQQPQQPPVGEQPQQPQLTQEQWMQQVAEQRAAAVGQLAETFQLSEDEATMMITDPARVIPQLGAEVMMRTMEQVNAQLQQYLPMMINFVQKQNEAQVETAKTFYNAWPKLNMQEHGDTVSRYAATYAQVNPQASDEDIIRDVGAQVMFALKIPVDAEPDSTTQNSTPPPAPAPAFRPAGSTQQAMPGDSQNMNEFEAIAQEWLDEE